MRDKSTGKHFAGMLSSEMKLFLSNDEQLVLRMVLMTWLYDKVSMRIAENTWEECVKQASKMKAIHAREVAEDLLEAEEFAEVKKQHFAMLYPTFQKVDRDLDNLDEHQMIQYCIAQETDLVKFYQGFHEFGIETENARSIISAHKEQVLNQLNVWQQRQYSIDEALEEI